MKEGARRGVLDRFYAKLAELERIVGGKRVLAECDGRMDWPRRGVYFFFEDGEYREDGVNPRVVRVGTHALRPSKSTLWGRLSAHRGTVGGSRPGGGNHRGSIFRLHIGGALLAQGEWPDVIRTTWGDGGSAPGSVTDAEYPLEAAVSRHVRSMPFLWLAVDDEREGMRDRAMIEAGAISLLSNGSGTTIDVASNKWLGHGARAMLVRCSGLWNVEHVQDEASDDFLDTLSGYLEKYAERSLQP